MSTKIEWCDETINPIQDVRKGPSGRGYHCTKCSPGCEHCYAERINMLRGNGHVFDGEDIDFTHFEMLDSELEKPLHWTKPRAIFWQSMGDLFHENVPFGFVDQVMAVVALTPQHFHLMLTKREKRMFRYFTDHLMGGSKIFDVAVRLAGSVIGPLMVDQAIKGGWENLYKGLTICNQPEADAKLPEFLKLPGKIFLNLEPMLGAIFLPGSIGHWEDLRPDALTGRKGKWVSEGEIMSRIDAVILGGETGPGARPMQPDWARSVRDQCAAAGVPFCLKFLNKKDGRVLDGRTHDELPWRSHAT